MANGADAQILQILRGRAPQDRPRRSILAEGSFVPLEAKAAQPLAMSMIAARFPRRIVVQSQQRVQQTVIIPRL